MAAAADSAAGRQLQHALAHRPAGAAVSGRSRGPDGDAAGHPPPRGLRADRGPADGLPGHGGHLLLYVHRRRLLLRPLSGGPGGLLDRPLPPGRDSGRSRGHHLLPGHLSELLPRGRGAAGGLAAAGDPGRPPDLPEPDPRGSAAGAGPGTGHGRLPGPGPAHHPGGGAGGLYGPQRHGPAGPSGHPRAGAAVLYGLYRRSFAQHRRLYLLLRQISPAAGRSRDGVSANPAAGPAAAGISSI